MTGRGRLGLEGLLDGFVRLAHTAAAEEVLAFAQRWGVFWHRKLDKGGGQDSVQSWIRLARQTDSVLRLAIALRDGSDPGSEAYRYLPARLGVRVAPATKPSRKFLISALEMSVRLRIDRLAVFPQWDQRSRKIVFRLGGGSLSAGLDVEIVRALTGSHVFCCSECGRPYARKNHPRKGEDNFCPICGPRAARRRAKRRYREKNRTPG